MRIKWLQANQRSLDFLLTMTSREVNARYKHAVLGFLWVFLNPVLQMLVMGFVFSFFVPVEVDNYFLFIFSGLLPWSFFNISLSKATPSIVNEAQLVQKAKFPREVIILAIVLSNLFHFIVSLIILVLLLVADKLFLEHYTLTQLMGYLAQIVLIFPLTIWLVMLTTGVSLLTSALNVKYRDINFIVQALVPLWFYATPIVYSLKLLPEKWYPLFYLNPVTAIIEGFQWALINQSPASIDLSFISLVMTLLAVYIGVFVFNYEKKWFNDWF